MRRALATAGFLGIVLGVTARAAAQGLPLVAPVAGPPKVSWLGPTGDANGAAGDAAAIEALRLGLFGDVPPSGDSACAPAGTATAAAPGFAPMALAAVRLVPRLSLVGFSRGGCALDGAGGGGLVYVAPVRRNVSLALSAGALYGPHAGPGGAPVKATQLRADFLFYRAGGRAFTLGVGTRGISFGGVL